MGSSPLRAKIGFFEQLDWRDADFDDPDIDELALRKRSRAFFRKSTKQQSPTSPSSPPPLSSVQASPQVPRRTVSEPSPAASHPQETIVKGTPLQTEKVRQRVSAFAAIASAANLDFVEETPVSAGTRRGATNAARILFRRSVTSPLPLNQVDAPESASPVPAMAPGGKNKRKRNSGSDELKLVPETDRVFRDLSFFYVPNDDVNPARKIRIAKAREFGANWVRSVEAATHVIVDKKLEYKHIEAIVGPVVTARKAASASPLIVVNEEYPLDCLKFRLVLNPKQWKYRVLGLPEPPPGSSAATASSRVAQDTPQASSEESLQIKTVVPPPKDTPPQAVEEDRGGWERPGPRATSPEVVIPSSQELPLAEPGQSSPQSDSQHSDLQELAPVELGDAEHPATTGPADELTSYIEMIVQYKDLPLDDDSDDVQSAKGSFRPAASDDGDSDDISGSEEEREHKKKRTAKAASRSGRKNLNWEDQFACNRGGTKEDPSNASANPNARTIEVLESMCDYYTRIDDHWRIMAYRKAIKTLRRQNRRITTEEEAVLLPSIGSRLAKKIEEIVTTDRLRRLEYAQEESLDNVLQLFLKIYGVGHSQACKWIAQGHRTLDDLATKAKLTANQRMGIERYDDLTTRIPRREIQALGRHVTATAAEIDPDVELLIGGSYRRGADTSGDIDFIITKKGSTSTDDLVPFLDELVSRLFDSGFLVATVAAHTKGGGGSKWHGCCVLPRSSTPLGALGEEQGEQGESDTPPPPQVWRRIDLLLVPETEYGAALIYFTGNDIFNRSIRLLASKKGMRLNQRGLFRDVMRGPGRVKVTEGQLVEGRDEKRIFEILGVKWREPKERWC